MHFRFIHLVNPIAISVASFTTMKLILQTEVFITNIAALFIKNVPCKLLCVFAAMILYNWIYFDLS